MGSRGASLIDLVDFAFPDLDFLDVDATGTEIRVNEIIP